jgi:hypothetical protein
MSSMTPASPPAARLPPPATSSPATDSRVCTSPTRGWAPWCICGLGSRSAHRVIAWPIPPVPVAARGAADGERPLCRDEPPSRKAAILPMLARHPLVILVVTGHDARGVRQTRTPNRKENGSERAHLRLDGRGAGRRLPAAAPSGVAEVEATFPGRDRMHGCPLPRHTFLSLITRAVQWPLEIRDKVIQEPKWTATASMR